MDFHCKFQEEIEKWATSAGLSAEQFVMQVMSERLTLLKQQKSGSAIMYRMKNNRLALEALPQASTQQTLFFSVLHKMALPKIQLALETMSKSWCLGIVFQTLEICQKP